MKKRSLIPGSALNVHDSGVWLLAVKSVSRSHWRRLFGWLVVGGRSRDRFYFVHSSSPPHSPGVQVNRVGDLLLHKWPQCRVLEEVWEDDWEEDGVVEPDHWRHQLRTEVSVSEFQFGTSLGGTGGRGLATHHQQVGHLHAESHHRSYNTFLLDFGKILSFLLPKIMKCLPNIL